MKTEIRVREHTVLPGQQIVELWYDGELIGQVCGADGPGIRVLSKFQQVPVRRDSMTLDVFIKPELIPELAVTLEAMKKEGLI